ncbi:MAG: hypothetical protein ACREQ5_13080 [Candidatus Dormibacteria bacterium]
MSQPEPVPMTRAMRSRTEIESVLAQKNPELISLLAVAFELLLDVRDLQWMNFQASDALVRILGATTNSPSLQKPPSGILLPR